VSVKIASIEPQDMGTERIAQRTKKGRSELGNAPQFRGETERKWVSWHVKHALFSG